jgi:cytochrome c-type biogenesis protein CcmE
MNLSENKPKKNWRLVVGLLLGVSVFYVFLNSAMEGGAYFLSVDEAVAAELPGNRLVRIKGTVIPGTYRNPEGTTEHRFSIESGGQRSMDIYYQGPIPDVFSEGREVVVEGQRGENGRLNATEVTAKCPSKYEGGMSEEARKRVGVDE